MLSLIFIISLILAVILFKKTSRNCKYEGLYFTGAILNVVLAIILGFLILDIIVDYIDVFNVDKKIDIYIEENKKIESDVSIAVGNYQIYENSTFKEIIDNPTVLAVVCPELKSNELVLKQVDLYIENSQKIKDLKLMKVTKDIYKFLLYLG